MIDEGIRCKDCLHFRGNAKLNDNEGYCLSPAKRIMESLFWKEGRPVKQKNPTVNKDTMWCNDFFQNND